LTYTDGSTSASYTYNQNGIRDSKTVNGVTTTYYLDGTKVLYESDGINNIYYTYDVDGTLISMNYNGSEYYYVFNALGDVTHLFDSSGDVVVEYRYDSYGNLDDSITLSGVGLANPYRYRSYRFDNETGYYYLQSRYYNPETGRFINADGIIRSSETTLGHNMYSYVNNNPIMLVDVNGYLPKWAKITIAVAAGVATGLLTGNVVAGICVGATVLSGLDYLDERALRDNQLEELERDLESIDNENIREAYRESATKAIEYRHGFAYAEWFPGFFTNPIDAAGSILGLNINIVGIIGDLAYDVYEDESMWLTPFTNGDITQEEIDEYRQDIREKYLRD
jgi:RHS repeat-associated protein